MTSRASYYRRRRRLLRRRRLCIRCGEHPPEIGHKLCALCLVEKKLKRPEPAADCKRERLQKRLAEIDALRARFVAGIGP